MYRTKNSLKMKRLYLTNQDFLPLPLKWREGLVDIVNPFGLTMVLGLPGSGKSYTILKPSLWQFIYEGYTA